MAKYNGAIIVFSTNSAETTGHLHAKKKKKKGERERENLDNLTLFKKLPEDNIGENRDDLRFGNDFADTTPKA